MHVLEPNILHDRTKFYSNNYDGARVLNKAESKSFWSSTKDNSLRESCQMSFHRHVIVLGGITMPVENLAQM